MIKSEIRIFVVFCVLLFIIAGCGPTYLDKDLNQQIVKICKDEYNIGVKVKRVGRTLGVYVPVDGLFESTVKIKDATTLEDIFAGIKFGKEAADKLENVSMVLSRAALSTDAPVDFYILIAADTKGSGIQIVITRYIVDMRRVMLGDVSRGDYVQRLLMGVDFDPVPNAKDTVKSFFYDLQQLPPHLLITRYFSKTTNASVVSSNFFLYLAESDYKEQKRFRVTGLKGLQIARSKVLVKCKVRETYRPARGYERFKFLYPSGFENEYLILIDTAYIPYFILEIVPLYSAGAEGSIERLSYPEKFAKYENSSLWDEGDFFLEDVQLPDFLARQLANRIKDLYQAAPGFKNKFSITLVNGEYQPAERKFKITLDIKTKRGRKGEPIDFTEAWRIISQVMRRYAFKDYDAVELFNIADARKELMTRTELLDKFWPKWLLRR